MIGKICGSKIVNLGIKILGGRMRTFFSVVKQKTKEK